MKEEKKKLTKNSRRSFLQKGIIGGTLAFLGIQASKVVLEKEEETVKMMTADGKLVEVPKKFLPEKTGKVVSNAELRKWVNEEK